MKITIRVGHYSVASSRSCEFYLAASIKIATSAAAPNYSPRGAGVIFCRLA